MKSFIPELIMWILMFIICFFVRIPFMYKLIICAVIGIGTGIVVAWIQDHDNGDDNDVDKTI